MTLRDFILLLPPGSNVEIRVADVDECDNVIHEVLYDGIALYYPRDFDDCEPYHIEAIRKNCIRIDF